MPTDEITDTHADTDAHEDQPTPEARRPNAVLGTVISLLFRTALAIVILGASVLLFMTLMRTKTQPATTDESGTQMLAVRAFEARPVRVRRDFEGYGTARSMRAADIVAEVAGLVVNRPDAIEVGRVVREGDTVLELDTDDTRNALLAARQSAAALEAQLDGLSVESDRIGTQLGYAQDEIAASERDLARIDQAIEAGAGNESQRDQALAALRRLQREADALRQRLDLIPSRRAQTEAQLAAQRATAATAQKNFERSTIRSPINGVIQRVDAREGDWLNRGSVAARVVDMSRLEIPVKLPASAITWVEVGDPVELYEGTGTDAPAHSGVITRIAPEADEQSRTITVYAEVLQAQRAEDPLASGRFVMGRVRPSDPTPRIVVPRRTIISGRVLVARPAEDPRRYVIEARPVELGYSFDDSLRAIDPEEDQWSVITRGVNPGDLVVTSLLDQLTQGRRVTLVSDTADAPDTAAAGDAAAAKGGAP